MKKRKSLYHGHRFRAAIISLAVRWYFRFQLSLRDIEELLFERGVVVSYETIRRWCDKFGAGFAHRVKAARRKPGRTWRVVTDQLRSYPAAKADIPELANVKHVFVKAAARVNNRAENSHQPTRERERRMRGFRDPKRTQAFLSSFGLIRQHFALKRHLLRASRYRKQLSSRFAAWREFTGIAQNPSTVS
ncbi:DDE-type integrase/transposase/recombinase [Paraburkholderia youngii]|uniref:Putative transposase n=1 Tax=Paraburkholderia youngii TaxID=2782701 RepID=A0A7W8LG65_9BURK|nr:DDE-type integrase/transposase/recombinase [Paraburkholderia youngii]MBB5406015.1 putative transposase [Paraburkholderia youngii]